MKRSPVTFIKITSERTSKCHGGPQISQHQTAVVLIHICSCYGNKANKAENNNYRNLIPFLEKLQNFSVVTECLTGFKWTHLWH